VKSEIVGGVGLVDKYFWIKPSLFFVTPSDNPTKIERGNKKKLNYFFSYQNYISIRKKKQIYKTYHLATHLSKNYTYFTPPFTNKTLPLPFKKKKIHKK
jgi:hypothetical protein